MKKRKAAESIITAFILLCSVTSYAQKNERIYADTLYGIATDSFVHNLGNIPAINSKLVKYFKYTGTGTVIITRTWTSDPHFICEYPKDPIVSGKIYSLTVCFALDGRQGIFDKQMGLTLSNGKNIAFTFRGNVVQKE